MRLIRWKPNYIADTFEDLFELQKQIERRELMSFLRLEINVSEDKRKIRIKANLPGLEQKDVGVSVDKGVLTIKAEKKQGYEKKDKNYYSCECRYGAFERSFALPAFVDSKKVVAHFKNGLLDIILPKVEKQSKGHKN